MTLAHRRILFGVFVILFVAASSLVLLYANGYRYHAQKKSIEKTGELVLDSRPQGGIVLLDGALVPSRILGLSLGKTHTPTQLKYLPSGDYHLEISKEGYLPWKMDVSVASGRSTIMKDISLFPRTEPRLLVKQDGIERIGRIDGTHIFFTTHSDIYVYNETTKTFSRLYTGDALNAASLATSPRGGYLLFRDGEEYHILSMKDGNSRKLTLRPGSGSVVWLNEYSLLSWSEQGIDVVSLPSEKKVSLYKGVVLDLSMGQDAYTLLKKKDTVELARISSDGGKIDALAQLPLSYKTIKNIFGENVVVSDVIGAQALYSPDRDSKLIRLPEGQLFWKNANHFALVHDFELLSFEKKVTEFESELLTRQSSLISEVGFRRGDSYLYFLSNGRIKALDISFPGVLNRYSLEGDGVKDFLFSQDSSAILAIGEVRGKSGLFEYDLTPEE